MTAFEPGQNVREISNARVMTVVAVLDEGNAAQTNNQPGDVTCTWTLNPEGSERRTRTFAPDEIELVEA